MTIKQEIGTVDLSIIYFFSWQACINFLPYIAQCRLPSYKTKKYTVSNIKRQVKLGHNFDFSGIIKSLFGRLTSADHFDM